ncbi:hypothetical protein CSB09_01485, partial [Candidatus Gracilibacteria bacterium]
GLQKSPCPSDIPLYKGGLQKSPCPSDIPLYKGGFKRKLSFLGGQESIREKEGTKEEDPESSSQMTGATGTTGTKSPCPIGHLPSQRGLTKKSLPSKF